MPPQIFPVPSDDEEGPSNDGEIMKHSTDPDPASKDSFDDDIFTDEDDEQNEGGGEVGAVDAVSKSPGSKKTGESATGKAGTPLRKRFQARRTGHRDSSEPPEDAEMAEAEESISHVESEGSGDPASDLEGGSGDPANDDAQPEYLQETQIEKGVDDEEESDATTDEVVEDGDQANGELVCL